MSKITEKELLEISENSIRERIEKISDELNKTTDTTTKEALQKNHKNSLEELGKVRKRLKGIS